MNWVYQVFSRRGYTLSSIARMTGWPLRAIMAVNPQITNPNASLSAGQLVNVPKQEKLNSFPVNPGDTLSSIIRFYNQVYAEGNWEFQITLGEVLAYNPNITNPNLIYPGTYIKMPDLG